MAFGFFKKKESADIIYMNGHIYTQDPEFPWATAVACKGDRILAVGDFDAMDEITDSDTQIVDLDEKFMFPGFIDAHGTPVLQAFAEHYLSIDREWDMEPVMDLLADYVDECDNDVIFGYGFNEKILERFSTPEEAHRPLDEIEFQRPVFLLGASGVHCWMNSVAASIIRDAADEDAMEYLSPEYILNVLNPLDFEQIEKAVREHADTLTDKGITAFFDLCSPEYFSNLYTDSLLAVIGEGEGDVKQRIFGSTYINRPFNPQLILHRLMSAKTNCIELNNLINANFIHLEIGGDACPVDFSQEALNTICLETAEKGFNIYIDAKDEESHDKACSAFALLRDKGYRNHTLVLASKYPVDENHAGLFLSTWPTHGLSETVFDHTDSVESALDALTTEAAEITGMSKELGSIEKGKRADFTVFEENPLNKDLQQFSRMHAEMTIIDGQIVYDAEEAVADEMCDMIFSMQV